MNKSVFPLWFYLTFPGSGEISKVQAMNLAEDSEEESGKLAGAACIMRAEIDVRTTVSCDEWTKANLIVSMSVTP